MIWFFVVYFVIGLFLLPLFHPMIESSVRTSPTPKLIRVTMTATALMAWPSLMAGFIGTLYLHIRRVSKGS